MAITRVNTFNGNVVASASSITNRPIGTAASDRIVWVIGYSTGSGANISGITIGGVAATFQFVGDASFDGPYIAWASVPTGTTATVALTRSGGTTSTIYVNAIYAIYGAKLPAVAYGITIDPPVSPQSVAVVAGGLVVAHSSSEVVNPSFTGLTQDDEDIADGYYETSASELIGASGTLSLGSNADFMFMWTSFEPAGSYTGTGAATLSIAASAAGVHGVAGAGAASLGVTASGTGTHVAPISGTGAATLAVSASASGAHGVSGTAAATLAITQTASGTHVSPVTGTGSAALAVTASASAAHGVAGSGASTLVVTADAEGEFFSGFSGSGSAVLTVTASAAGAHGVAGSAAALLAVSASASGIHVPSVTGSGAATLEMIGAGLGEFTRLFAWEPVPQTPETWAAQSATPEIWSPSASTPQTWTAEAATPEDWTPRPTNPETWH